ncbi:unnamed protein product [Ilex paraguariensis]|uniref:Uncharacterized protein n=1 Tax=Ilex paraguariensis TaxID=185542 RepID=A0ABC8RNQ7_9AQUA
MWSPSSLDRTLLRTDSLRMALTSTTFSKVEADDSPLMCSVWTCSLRILATNLFPKILQNSIFKIVCAFKQNNVGNSGILFDPSARTALALKTL